MKDLLKIVKNFLSNTPTYKTELNFDHIWNKYYWWIVAVIELSIILFFLIIILINIKTKTNG